MPIAGRVAVWAYFQEAVTLRIQYIRQ